MAVHYDFDMVSVTPEGLPDQFGDLTVTGVAAEKMAMFRDGRVVAMLEKADPAVRTFFEDSGFALQAYDSGAPSGRYPASDEAARVKVIEKLTANFTTHDLSGVNWGGFEFSAFMDVMENAQPLEDETLLAPPIRQQPSVAPSAQSVRNQKRKGLAMAGLALGVILILYTALEFIQ
ncbi:MAG: hypothetical protein AAFQ09_07000 [Pseudomonadota bacterium]